MVGSSGATLATARRCCVHGSVLRRLLELGAQLEYVDDDHLAPMLWRFSVVDDRAVDVFVVRDADSRLTSRDSAAVADWLRQRPETAAIFHCVRDHPSHTRFAVSGGLWGARRALLARLFNTRQVQYIHCVSKNCTPNWQVCINSVIGPIQWGHSVVVVVVVDIDAQAACDSGSSSDTW